MKFGFINKQLIKFSLIGFLAVFVDLAFYTFFLKYVFTGEMAGLSAESISKTLSFLCGMVITYQFNKRWTWKKKDRNHRRLVKFSILYGTSLVMNVAVNAFVIWFLNYIKDSIEVPHIYLLAFIAATGSSALLNYTGQRFWVFGHKQPK